MKKLEIIIRPDKLEILKNILNETTAGGLTVLTAMGCGNQKGSTDIESLKGLKISNMNLIPKVMAMVVVEDSDVDNILASIHSQLSTGKVGDGKVFVSDVSDSMRIRTGERGSKSI